MSLIRPDAPRKDPISGETSTATPVYAATSSTYAPYVPYAPPAHLNGVPPPLTGSPGRSLRIGKMHFHTAGLIRRKAAVTGFLAKPIQFRGMNFPEGTWVQMSSGKPDRIVLNQMATIGGMVCPTRATFRFYPDGFSITSGASVKKDQMVFDGMTGVQFDIHGRLKSGTLVIPFSLPVGILPAGTDLHFNPEGQLSHLVLPENTRLQGVLFAARILVPTFDDDFLGLPPITTIRGSTQLIEIETPVHFHSNGGISHGTVGETTQLGDVIRTQWEYLFFDEDGNPQR